MRGSNGLCRRLRPRPFVEDSVFAPRALVGPRRVYSGPTTRCIGSCHQLRWPLLRPQGPCPPRVATPQPHPSTSSLSSSWPSYDWWCSGNRDFSEEGGECQPPIGIAHRRPAEVPARGQEKCPFAVRSSAHRVVVACGRGTVEGQPRSSSTPDRAKSNAIRRLRDLGYEVTLTRAAA